ncbi:phage holin family protein [Veillonella sp. LMAG:2]|uniref:phage holin family protein n=1 Tax=Veillonella sp. LMAG:2 TaxID=1969164 RepID=UPI0025EF4187|nr:phage holin family protein [Veillonella sp. LMAG:2]
MISIQCFQDMWESLIAAWWVKSALSVIAAVAIWLIGLKHVQVLGIFILLVGFDLVTKWASVAYKMLIENFGYDPEHIASWEKYRAIPTAIDLNLIKSEYMRKGFCDKVLTYVTVTAAAFLFDWLAGKNSFAVNLVWLYLGSSEFLSILENLRDGGNKSMGRFLELVRDKIENKVKF